MIYLAAAYVAIWLLLGFFLVFLYRKQKKLEFKLESLHQARRPGFGLSSEG